MNRTAKSRKNQNAWREGKLQVFMNTGNGHHQTSDDERIFQTNKRTFQKQAL